MAPDTTDLRRTEPDADPVQLERECCARIALLAAFDATDPAVVEALEHVAKLILMRGQ